MKKSFHNFASICILALFPNFTNSAEIGETFNSGNDNAWIRYEPLASHGGVSEFSFPDGAYRLQAEASPDPAQFGATRLGSLRLDFVTGNFSQDFDLLEWNPNLNQSFGVLGRANDLGLGSTAGYFFSYSTAGFISISRIDNDQPTILASASVFLNPERRYYFSFQGFGPDLFGGVYDPENGNRIISGVAVSDSTYGLGATGFYLQSDLSTSGVDATFDNFRAFTLIPEPSTLSLLAMAGLSGLWISYRRRISSQ